MQMLYYTMLYPTLTMAYYCGRRPPKQHKQIGHLKTAVGMTFESITQSFQDIIFETNAINAPKAILTTAGSKVLPICCITC